MQSRCIVETVARTSPAQIKAVLKKVRAPLPAPPDLSTNPFATQLLLRSGLECTEKQKSMAVTTIDALVPPTFQGYENSPLQLPVAQLQAWSSSSSAHAFATGAVAVALPAQPRAAPAPMPMRQLSHQADGGRLSGR